MTASRTKAATRRGSKSASVPRSSKPDRKGAGRLVVLPTEPTLFRFCKSGWAVLVDKVPSQQGTRFVCPFCTQSHRVSGPVRGFRKVRKAQWVKLRRVDE